MSLMCRLAARASFNHGLSRTLSQPFMNSPRTKLPLSYPQCHLSPFTTIRIKPSRKEVECETGIMEHDAYNKSLGRPLSPHFRIYKKQLTSLLSFSHRLTGLMMTSYMYIVVAGTYLWTDITSFFEYLCTFDETLGEANWDMAHNTVKFLVAYPFCYHSMNAIRHLGWDFGKFLALKEIYSTGWTVQALTIVVSLLITFMI